MLNMRPLYSDEAFEVNGYGFMYYYHREKGLLKERIAVPRAARYRIMQLVEEKPA